MSTNSTSEALQGWTSSPDGRGSFNILWACTATIFLSTWSAICMNVPDPSDSKWKVFKRKAWITLISILGPEYLLAYALGEWRSARMSVARVKKLRQHDRWTLKHAFFAEMGGFVLQTSDNICCFLDTNYIHWLLEHRVISDEQFEKDFLVDVKIIDDRNKSDTFVRVIAVGQALWFCVNVAARGLQGLPVTTLEITTVGIVVDSILVYYFWRRKPASVESTEIVKVGKTLNQIIMFQEDGEARGRFNSKDPLGFISRDSWSLNLMYHYLRNILKNLLRRFRDEKVDSVFLGRRSENDVAPVRGVAWFIGLFSTTAFIGINFVAWDFSFPSPLEKLLWRLSCCGIFAIMIFVLCVFEIGYTNAAIERMQKRVREERKALELSEAPGEKSGWRNRLIYRSRVIAMKLRNNSTDQDPKMDVSLCFVALTLIFGLYMLLRVYVLVEDVIAFRAMPVGTYATVDWWKFVPHLG